MPKPTKPSFGSFVTMPPAYFWKPIPETSKQLDAVDEPDADGVLQGLAVYGLRRVRQVRQV